MTNVVAFVETDLILTSLIMARRTIVRDRVVVVVVAGVMMRDEDYCDWTDVALVSSLHNYCWR